MANIVLQHIEDRYPAGTVVKAYDRPGTPGGALGASIAQGTVQSDGSLTITGLQAGHSYVLHSDTVDRRVTVTVDPVTLSNLTEALDDKQDVGPWTADQAAGGFNLTGLADPGDPQDADTQAARDAAIVSATPDLSGLQVTSEKGQAGGYLPQSADPTDAGKFADAYTGAPTLLGGGSSGGPVEIVVPFAWDDSDPELLTGKVIYTPAPGDRLLWESAGSVIEAFDGTSPFARVWTQGGDPVNDAILALDLTSADALTASNIAKAVSVKETLAVNSAMYLVAAVPLVLTVWNDLDSSAIDSTMGSGEIRLLVMPKGTPA